jgi:hypothetical protein
MGDPSPGCRLLGCSNVVQGLETNMSDVDGFVAADPRERRHLTRRTILRGFVIPVLAALAAAVFVTAANAGKCCEADGADSVTVERAS